MDIVRSLTGAGVMILMFLVMKELVVPKEEK